MKDEESDVDNKDLVKKDESDAKAKVKKETVKQEKGRFEQGVKAHSVHEANKIREHRCEEIKIA